MSYRLSRASTARRYLTGNVRIQMVDRPASHDPIRGRILHPSIRRDFRVEVEFKDLAHASGERRGAWRADRPPAMRRKVGGVPVKDGLGIGVSGNRSCGFQLCLYAGLRGAIKV